MSSSHDPYQFSRYAVFFSCKRLPLLEGTHLTVFCIPTLLNNNYFSTCSIMNEYSYLYADLYNSLHLELVQTGITLTQSLIDFEN